MSDASTNDRLGEFRIDEESPDSETRVLVVQGDADLHSAPELRGRLRSAIDDGTTRIVVDLSGTTVIDSTSLGVLLGAMKRLRERDGRVRIVVARPEVRRVFELTMLDRIFELYATRAEALAEVPDEAG